MDDFKTFLRAEGKTDETVSSYCRTVLDYKKWYQESYGAEPEKLLGVNVSDYVAYLRAVRNIRGTSLNPKVAGLKCYNRFLIESGVQAEIVVVDKHRDKIQASGVSPTDIDQKEVDAFRQAVLIGSGIRDHAIVTTLAYAGLRVSELVNLKLANADLVGKEITVYGKGNKVRIVFMSPKVGNAISEYLKERNSDSPYLFVSRQANKLHRSTINRIMDKHHEDMHPHKLRHFFCTHALEVGFSLAEVAYMAGHASVHTTTGYLGASRREMLEKAGRL